RRMVLKLGNALSHPDTRRTLVGETRPIRIAAGMTRLVITGPDGRETDWDQSRLGAGGEVSFVATDAPGHYTVRAAFAGPLAPLEGESFDVNVDTHESDLRAISVEEATAVLLGTSSGTRAESTALARAQALRGLANPDLI